MMATEKTAKKTTGQQDIEAYLQEKVPVFLMRDDYRYSDDVTVTYNGVNYRIQRGVTVMVPRCVKLVLEDANDQRAAAMAFTHQLMERSEKSANI